MSRKRVHLISNAHLDPVWLWRWEEGCTEALSTFQTASDLVDEYDEFIFNHNESILYQWVKDHNPLLFEKIKTQIKKNKWEVIGGWYLQPDCNMPSGESMVRNIMLGRIFFKENFNAYPTTAINFDSFGHSQGLVQILNQSGYENYLIYRPDQSNYEFEDGDFIWKGLADSAVVVHRSDEGYNSVWGNAATELEDFLKKKEQEEVTLFLWGVGDHGGGPTRKDLDDFRRKIKENDYEIIHSTPEEYFKEVKKSGKKLKEVNRGLNPVAQGCYTSQIRVKQKHRLLENEIYAAEKMASAAFLQYNRPYKKEVFDEAIKDLVFAEFHDALPGSGSKLVEEDTIRILDHGLEIMSREKLFAAIALAAGEPRVVPGTSTILFYNPHPYDITGIFECEVGLPKQNWTTQFMYPEVEFEGVKIPTQAEKECSNFAIDWRKKVVIWATLKAASMNRMDVYFKPMDKRPEYEEIVSKKYYEFKNDHMKVRINTTTGLIDEYWVKGKKYLDKRSFALTMKDDTYNPWGIGSHISSCQRTFQLLTPHEGSAFSGLNDKVIPPVRVIEDGDVRTVVEAVFGLHESKAYIRYKLPKRGTAFEVEVMVHFQEKEQSLKLMLHTTNGVNDSFLGQIMFGREELKKDGEEVVAQKWVMTNDNDKKQALLVVNNGTHGFSYEEGVLGLTLLRSAGYTASDFIMGKALHEAQYAPRMEQGERKLSFIINGGSIEEISENADNMAQSFNEKPYGFAYCPPGIGEKKDSFLQIDNRSIIVSAFKKAEQTEDYILRLYESSGKRQEAIIHISALDIREKVIFNPNEIKTFFIRIQEKFIKETTIIEGI